MTGAAACGRVIIKKINRYPLLHFQNYSPTLKIPAMRTSFTGRITTTLLVVVVIIIGVVVTVPV